MCTPAIHFFKRIYPESTIGIFSSSKAAASVFAENEDIDFRHTGNNSLTFNLVATRYSFVICLNKKSEYFTKKCPVPVYAIPKFNENSHHSDQILSFMSSLIGIDHTDTDRKYFITHKRKTRQPLIAPKAKEELYIGLHLGCGRIALHGWNLFYKAARTHRKLWPVDNYLTLIESITSFNPDIKIIITGTKNESFLGRKIESKIPSVINMIGRTTAIQLYHLMSELDLFITQDCGALHMASASNVSTISLYGPTNHKLTGVYPFHKRHTIIQRSTMAEISVNEVLRSVTDRLSPQPRVFAS